jgi:hypothetical protein
MRKPRLYVLLTGTQASVKGKNSGIRCKHVPKEREKKKYGTTASSIHTIHTQTKSEEITQEAGRRAYAYQEDYLQLPLRPEAQTTQISTCNVQEEVAKYGLPRARAPKGKQRFCRATSRLSMQQATKTSNNIPELHLALVLALAFRFSMNSLRNSSKKQKAHEAEEEEKEEGEMGRMKRKEGGEGRRRGRSSRTFALLRLLLFWAISNLALR